MKNEKIDPRERIDTDLKKINQLSSLLLNSDYEKYDADAIFGMISSTASSAQANYYFEVSQGDEHE